MSQQVGQLQANLLHIRPGDRRQCNLTLDLVNDTGGPGGLIIMGQVFYRDYTPVSIFPSANSQPRLESWNMLPSVPYAEPQAYVDNRNGLGPWALANIQRKGYTSEELYPYPIGSEMLYFAPEQPIRKDTFQQLAQRAQSPSVSGTAPTKGIYTGVNELE